MKTTTIATLALLMGATLLAPATPAEARLRAEAVVGPMTVDEAGPALARRGRGADDPAGHGVGDDRGRRGKNGGKGRGRGADDGPGHTFLVPEEAIGLVLLAPASNAARS